MDLGGVGLTPVGYGYRSIEYLIKSCIRVESGGTDRASRQRIVEDIDVAGIVATPANSNYNELVIEAARQSILNDGETVSVRETQPI